MSAHRLPYMSRIEPEERRAGNTCLWFFFFFFFFFEELIRGGDGSHVPALNVFMYRCTCMLFLKDCRGISVSSPYPIHPLHGTLVAGRFKHKNVQISGGRKRDTERDEGNGREGNRRGG